MHLRFDGKLGFPGGIIDGNETVIDGVTREIKEEMNIDVKLCPEDFVSLETVEYHRQKHDKVWNKMNLYFFAKEMDESTFLQMEEKCRKAQHFGIEVLGTIRAPLHQWTNATNAEQKPEGFPLFLTHTFAGNAKGQLLLALNKHKIMTEENLISAYKMYHQKKDRR